MLTVGSLFSGIGGIDLGLERAGMTVIWQAETDPYASRVLAKHWPDVPNLGDVKQIDWSTIERPDLICGGYPCQPFSQAGRRAGTADPRHLWPWFAHALRLLRPRWALLENVPGHLSLGFAAVLADLAALGFDAEWDLLPASAFGAPHLRYRLFVVAHARGQQHEGSSDVVWRPSTEGFPQASVAHPNGQRLEERWLPAEGWADLPDAARRGGSGPAVADPNGQGPQGHRPERRLGEGGEEIETGRGGDVADASGRRRDERQHRNRPAADGERRERPALPSEARRGRSDHLMADTDGPPGDRERSPGQAVLRPSTLQRPGRCSCCDGDHWATEPDVGRVANGIPSRVDRLRCLGNAVVPQVAEYVGRLLAAHIECSPDAGTLEP